MRNYFKTLGLSAIVCLTACGGDDDSGSGGLIPCVGGQFCTVGFTCVGGLCVPSLGETSNGDLGDGDGDDTPGDGDGDGGDGDGDGGDGDGDAGDGDGDGGDGDGDGDGGDGDGDGDGDGGDGDGDGDGGDGDGDPGPFDNCGWDRANMWYACGLSGENQQFPIMCENENALLVDDPCPMGFGIEGCCDSNGDNWWCEGGVVAFEDCP